MISTLGLQLWTVRDYFKDLDFADLTFRKLKEMGYTEVQTAGLYDFAPEEFAEITKKHGIKIIGTHFNWNLVQNQPEEMIRIHKILGTTNIGIGSTPWSARKDLQGLIQFVDDFNKMGEFYAKQGFKLTYHNHNWEFKKADGNKTMMDIFCAEFDKKNISFVLDTCWVQAGCANIHEWLEKLAGRIDILHLKDVCLTDELAPIMTEIGSGFVPWDAVIHLAEKAGVQHYVVEQDMNFANGNPFDSIRQSAQYLHKYKKEV